MLRLSLILLLLANLIGTAQPVVAAQEKIHIAVASSLRGPVDHITNEFERQFPNYQVTIAYVASGKLVAQMVHGAPYALLISAEPRYLEALHQRQLTAGAPVLLGYGELVLWHPRLRGDVAALLRQSDFVALAQPKHAPYGQAAIAYMKQQMTEEVYASKLVFGENVAQAAHRVHVGAANSGFVALSQMLELEVPRADYTRLEGAPLLPQTMALTQAGAQKRAAQSLYDFIRAEQGQQILASYGYASPTVEVSEYAASE